MAAESENARFCREWHLSAGDEAQFRPNGEAGNYCVVARHGDALVTEVVNVLHTVQ